MIEHILRSYYRLMVTVKQGHILLTQECSQKSCHLWLRELMYGLLVFVMMLRELNYMSDATCRDTGHVGEHLLVTRHIIIPPVDMNKMLYLVLSSLLLSALTIRYSL